MPPGSPEKPATPDPHGQMLKLVAKGFYRELINYGVKEPEIVTVASHLLDNLVLKSPPTATRKDEYNRLFTVRDVHDDWAASRRLTVHEVSLTPLDVAQVPRIAGWLEVPKVRNSFFPRFPQDAEGLTRRLLAPDSEYFSIRFRDEFVGLIGAEHIDPDSAKVEMKKLVGESVMRGKGIGKRATFLFLYYVFVVRGLFKVYLHTLDINIRNLNLNGNFGFWLEGVFFEEVADAQERQDVVRMALTAPVWKDLFK